MKTRPLERRARAEVRQAEYAALTTEQKLERAGLRGGESRKEIHRLNRILAEVAIAQAKANKK